MKRIWILVIALFCASILEAQTTTITLANVTDSDGTVWANGSWQIDFNPNPNNPGEGQYTQNGAHLNGSVTHQKGSLSGSGGATFTIYDSSTITPVGSGWKLLVCPYASSLCGTYTFSSSGASQNITSNVNAIIPAPRFTAKIGAYGYNSIEAQPLNIPGATYWDVNQGCQNFYNTTTGLWACTSATGAVPAGPAFAVNFANNAVSNFQGDSSFTFNPSNHLLTAQQINNFRNAASYQTGGGNNGIANASSGANNGIVIADPSYGITEKVFPNSFSAQGLHFTDNRNGSTVDFFHNPFYSTSGIVNNPIWFADTGQDWTGHSVYCLFDITPANVYGPGISPTGNTTNVTNCDRNTYTAIQPGWSLGNPPVGPSGWNVNKAASIRHNVNSAGIAQGLTIEQIKPAIGDDYGMYIYNTTHGGWRSPSDQATSTVGLNVLEDSYTYVGKADSTVSHPVLLSTTTNYVDNCAGFPSGSFPACPQSSYQQLGVGQTIVDIGACGSYPNSCPAAPYTGQITNIATGLDGIGSAVTISGTVPVSTAWGTIATNVATPLVTVPPFTTAETFNVNIESGTFDTSHLVCTDSQFHEQAYPTAVGSVSGGIQSVTIPWRHAHAAGGHLYQGGACGLGLEIPAYTENPTNNVPLRYLFDVVGSTGANTLQAIYFRTGIGYGIMQVVSTLIYQTITASAFTNGGSGTTVTGSYSGGTMFGPQLQANKSAMLFSGSSDSALNAVCSNITWTSFTSFTCTIAGLSGSHSSSTTVTGTLVTAGGTRLNAYSLWPIAETLDVRDNTVTPPVIDGKNLGIEPNVMSITAGDYIEQTHNYAQNVSNIFKGDTIYNPYGQYNSNVTFAYGPGISGGGSSETNNAMYYDRNLNPDNIYIGSGGYLVPANYHSVGGSFYIDNLWAEDPVNALNLVYSTPAHIIDPNYSYAVWTDYVNGSPCSQFYSPYLNTVTWSGCTSTFNGNVNLPAINLQTTVGMVSALGYNYAPYSNNLLGPTWIPGTGVATTVCGLSDDQGNPACSMTYVSGSRANLADTNTGAYTNIPNGQIFSMQVRAKGDVGGEGLGLEFAGNQISNNITPLTTNWQNYCAVFATFSSGALTNFGAIDVSAGQKIYISNVVVRPGSVCGPPLLTTNSQVITPTVINTIGGSPICTTANGACPTGGGGSMTWPAGGAGIPNYNGSSGWGTTYDTTNKIPAAFVNITPGLTQLTGDIACGPGVGSTACTLPAVNAGVGACGDATHVCQATHNAKGQTTAAAPVAITFPTGIANIQISIGSFAIPANTCYGSTGSTTPATATMTGLGTTSVPFASFSGNPNAIVGWGTAGGLNLSMWPTSNTLNYLVCNATSSSITGGAITFNVGAR